MAITKASSSAVAAAAKGDLVVGNATNDSGVLAVGANDTILTADSSTATGLKWATPAAGGAYTLLSTTTISGNTNITSISQSYKFLYVVAIGIYNSTASPELRIRFNNDSGSNYVNRKVRTDGTQIITAADTGIVLTRVNTTNDYINYAVGSFFLTNYTLSEPKIIQANLASSSQGDWGNGTWADNTAISQLNFYVTGGTLSGGTIRIYGVN